MTRYRDETPLHLLGYQITDRNYVDRWNMLINAGIPHLGLYRTVRTLLGLIYLTVQAGEGSVERRRHALTEWRLDLDMIIDRFRDTSDLKRADLQQYINEMLYVLNRHGVEKKYGQASLREARSASEKTPVLWRWWACKS